MALRRQMHHRVRLMRGEYLPHRRRIGDVRAHQHMAVVPARLLQRLLGGRVGHLVDIDHDVVGVAQQVPHHRRADEPASAGQQQFNALGHPLLT